MMLSLSLLLVGAQQGRIEHQVQILSYQRQLMTVRQQVESTLSQVIATHEWPKPRVASCQRFSSVTVCFKSITAELGIVCAVIQTKLAGDASGYDAFATTFYRVARLFSARI